MFRLNGDWYSEFPPVKGVNTRIYDNHSIVAVTSYGGLTGGHAALYLEYIDADGDALVEKIHLTASAKGSGTAESTGSGSFASGSTGSSEIDINIEEKEREIEHTGRADNLHYQSWMITNNQRSALKFAAIRFKFKNKTGRYCYRVAGGLVGWLSTRPGKRGVNCADFCIKILGEAGIANIDNAVINTPKRIASE